MDSISSCNWAGNITANSEQTGMTGGTPEPCRHDIDQLVALMPRTHVVWRDMDLAHGKMWNILDIVYIYTPYVNTYSMLIPQSS